jgi:hypothetical protein
MAFLQISYLYSGLVTLLLLVNFKGKLLEMQYLILKRLLAKRSSPFTIIRKRSIKTLKSVTISLKGGRRTIKLYYLSKKNKLNMLL